MIRRFPAHIRVADNAMFGLVVCALASVVTIVPLFLIHQACIAEILK